LAGQGSPDTIRTEVDGSKKKSSIFLLVPIVSYAIMVSMNQLKTNRMLVNVLLDRSGSMSTTRAGTVSGYNEYINGLRADNASEYEITLIQFDACGHDLGPELTISYENMPLAAVPELTLADYQPRGNTPLYDAIGECVRRVEANGRAITVVVITDGMENASKEFTRESVKSLITGKQTKGWTFVFIGAEIDSYAVGGSVGMPAGNISNYVKGQESQLYAATASATMRKSARNRVDGVQASAHEAFFDDAEKVAMGDATAPGGNPTGSATFHQQQAIDTGATPPKVGRPKRRTWATTAR
jgi:hypothetical protein